MKRCRTATLRLLIALLIWTSAIAIAGTSPRATPHVLEITFGVFRPPYIFEKKDLGVDFEVAEAIFKAIGVPFKSNHSTNQRAWKEFDLGRADGIVGVAPEKDHDNMFFSAPILFYDNVAISKSKKKIKLAKISDLKDIRFLSFEKAYRYLGPEYAAVMRSVKRDTDVSSQLVQNKLFWSDKVDVIILDRHVFEHYRQQLKSEMNTSDEVVIHRIFPPIASWRCVVFRDRAIRDEFNVGLAKIKANSTYKKILDKYFHSKTVPR